MYALLSIIIETTSCIVTLICLFDVVIAILSNDYVLYTTKL